MDKIYVGVDVNLSGYGLAIFAPEEIKLEFIQFVRKDKIDEAIFEYVRATKRLSQIVHMFANDRPIVAAIEDPTAMEKGAWQTASILNKHVGMLSLELNSTGKRCIFPSSVIWKKAIIGHGKATKEDVMLKTSKILLGVETPEYFEGNHHISDAVALAEYAKRWDLKTLDNKEGDKDGRLDDGK